MVESGLSVSVVIPLYNKRDYIARAVHSVLEQAVFPMEVIVVDDGSTDDGAQVVKNIHHPRLRLIQQANGGECAARNRGIAEASHSLIAFLDADDEWKPDFLARIQKLVARFPKCGAYATSAQIIKPDLSSVFPRLVNIPQEPWTGLIPNFFELFQAGYAFNASSIVVPKVVLDEVGGFPKGVTISGDVACWVNIALRYPIAFDPARAVIYHQEAQNRVGHVYKPLREMPYIQPLRAALEAGTVPTGLEEEAFEFMAQKQIMVTVENIMAGDPAYAIQLLTTCGRTRKYKRDWLWWRFWAFLPAGWPKAFLRAKQFLLRQVA